MNTSNGNGAPRLVLEQQRSTFLATVAAQAVFSLELRPATQAEEDFAVKFTAYNPLTGSITLTRDLTLADALYTLKEWQLDPAPFITAARGLGWHYYAVNGDYVVLQVTPTRIFVTGALADALYAGDLVNVPGWDSLGSVSRVRYVGIFGADDVRAVFPDWDGAQILAFLEEYDAVLNADLTTAFAEIVQRCGRRWLAEKENADTDADTEDTEIPW